MSEKNKSLRLIFSNEKSNIVDITTGEKLPIQVSEPVISGPLEVFKQRIFSIMVGSDSTIKPKEHTPTTITD